jgi:hypothetical protein
MKKNSLSGFKSFYLWAILLLGLAVRLLFLATPHMDSDQAVTGLMARHILGGEFPFFFYGQDYCGSIEAYLASTIFWLFGATRFTLNFTICLESIFFIFFIYFLARLFFEEKTGLLAALYTALPSYYLIFHSVLARAAYIEIPIIGVLLLTVGYKIIYCRAEQKGLFFILGFLCGLGIWTHFLIIFFLPPVFLLWLIRDPWLWKRPGVLFVFAGLVLGGLPLWAHNTAHPLVTWHYLMGTAGGDESAWESLKDFFLFRFPEALGVKNNDSEKFIIPYLSPVIYLLYLAVFGVLLILRRKGFWGFFKFRMEQSQGLDLLILFLFLFPVIFSFSGFASAHTSRYLQPVFAVLPVLFAVFTLKLKNLSWVLASGFLALHLFSNISGTMTRLPLVSPKELQNFNQARANDQGLFAFLKKKNIRHLYTMDYWNSLRLTFDAQEEILFSQPVGERYPLYADLIDQDPQPAFLFAGENKDFEETLKNMGGRYQKGAVSGYCVYYDFSPPPYEFKDLLPTDWKVASNYNSEEGSRIFDRNLATLWSTLSPKNKAAYLQIDLGKIVHDLGKLTLYFGKGEETPRGLRLEISDDGLKWHLLRETSGFWNSLFWSGPHPFYRPLEPRADITFPPRSGRYLRLTQISYDPAHFWTLSECFIYQAMPKTKNPPGDSRELISFLKSFEPERIYASPWANAQLPLAWRARQRNLSADPEKEGQVNMLLNPVFVIEKDQSSTLTQFIKHELKTPYEEREVSNRLIDTFPAVPSPFQPLSAQDWRFQTNANAAGAGLAADGKMNTRWSTGRPQQPGDFFQIDLGKEEKVARINLLVANSRNDFPRGFVIQSSIDGRAWISLNEILSPVTLHWTGETLLKGNPDLDFILPPTTMRFLKIIQTGRDETYYWSIHEIKIYRRGEG